MYIMNSIVSSLYNMVYGVWSVGFEGFFAKSCKKNNPNIFIYGVKNLPNLYTDTLWSAEVI